VTKLGRRFYQRPAIDLARDLIGKVLVRRIDGKTLRARIVETEAYVGTHDLACHAAKGRTKRTEIMFGPGGHAYVYFIYGMHEMFNIVASVEGDAQAVLLRAAEAMDGWKINLSGPGRLAKGMQINRKLNGIDLTGDDLFVARVGRGKPKIVTGTRVGVDYAGDWAAEALRFMEAGNRAVSKPWVKGMKGKGSDETPRLLQAEVTF
jgi:DNA-3-methyladenine glycosylase